MMVDINFKNIRAYDGSQQNGFEELVCQLARLMPPEDAKSFIRKEGSGGDAGVECFWLCSDGSEYAWQAKYFTEALDSSQWSQIDESVESAINKHPNIRRYYVCVPRDRTDSRRKNKMGEPVVTALDTWNLYRKKWEKMALAKGHEIEFIYWGISKRAVMVSFFTYIKKEKRRRMSWEMYRCYYVSMLALLVHHV